jgi:hypothetical protein
MAEKITQQMADRVAAKLQALYDSSSGKERRVLETILASVSESADVPGYTAGFGLFLEVRGIRRVARTPRRARIRIPLPKVPQGIIIIC